MLSNGEKYSGEFREGKIWGEGKLLLSNKDNFTGTFVDNLFQGFGEYHCAQSLVSYKGTWYEGQYHGKGELTSEDPEGVDYQGEILGGLFDGQGRITYKKTGNIYTGAWAKGKKTGLGEFKYVSGDTYLGGFLNDTLQGHGEYKYSNGNIYVGNFDSNQRNGTGEFMNNKEKTFYNGKWALDKQSGDGELLISESCLHYVGEFRNGLYHGHGELKTTIGANCNDRYVGDFKDGHKHGRGKFQYTNGDSYDGFWVLGQQYGYASILYAHKYEKYTGHVRDGLRHGSGEYQFADGTRYAGDFWEDQIVGYGELFYVNGEKYVGEFKNGVIHGRREYVYVDGNRFIRVFEKGGASEGRFIEKGKEGGGVKDVIEVNEPGTEVVPDEGGVGMVAGVWQQSDEVWGGDESVAPKIVVDEPWVDVDGDEPNMIEFLRAKRRPFVVAPDGAEEISDDESMTLEGGVKPVVQVQGEEDTKCVGAIMDSLGVLEKMNQNRKMVDAQNLEAMQEEVPIEAKKFDPSDLADDADKRIKIQKILDEIEEMQARAPVGSKHLSSNMATETIDLGDVQINSLCIGNNPYNQWMANQALGHLPIPNTITEVPVPQDLPPHVPHPANYKKAETERELIQVTNSEVANGMNPIPGGAPGPTIFCRWSGTQFVTVEDKGNWLMIPNPAVEGVSMQHEPFLPQRSFEERVRTIHRKDIDNIHARYNIFEEAEDMDIRVNREYARRRQIDYLPEEIESTTFLRKQFLIPANGKHVGDQNEYGEHHGQGTLSTYNGDIYMGMFAQGKIHGHGEFTYKNGNKYLGNQHHFFHQYLLGKFSEIAFCLRISRDSSPKKIPTKLQWRIWRFSKNFASLKILSQHFILYEVKSLGKVCRGNMENSQRVAA